MFSNSKGQSTIFMVIMVVGLFLAALILFVIGITTVKFHDAIDRDLPIGQVNLENVTADTFGQFHTMVINSADWWGISLIFGLIFGLFLSAYFTRNSLPKWGLILDIFIILGIFIAALYISSSYQTVLDALAGAGETFLEDYTPSTSRFIINLPIYVVTIGVIMMVLFHAAIPRRTEERIQQGGFLQGVQ